MKEELNQAVQYDHLEDEAEHALWLGDVEKWRADHRRLIELLAKAQTAVLEQDAALEGYVRDIHNHEKMRLRHELLVNSQSTDAVDEADLLATHKKLEVKHARARAAHERMSAHHTRVAKLIEILLEKIVEPM